LVYKDGLQLPSSTPLLASPPLLMAGARLMAIFRGVDPVVSLVLVKLFFLRMTLEALDETELTELLELVELRRFGCWCESFPNSSSSSSSLRRFSESRSRGGVGLDDGAPSAISSLTFTNPSVLALSDKIPADISVSIISPS